jgi:hypothetical protein
MNDYWTEIVTSSNPRRHRGLDDRKAQMFYLASYNIDMFRTFVLSDQFLSRFELSDDQREHFRNDDIALMKFAMQWLKFSLFGEGSLDIKGETLLKNQEENEVRQS